MIPQDTKDKYIELRANGYGSGYISQALNISRTTCSRWDAELRELIEDAREKRMQDVYDRYEMTRIARIELLGKTLKKIDAVLDQVDFECIDPVKLLDFKLKYTQALREEHVPVTAMDASSVTAFDIADRFNVLEMQIRNGDITAEQAERESSALSNLLKAHEVVDTEQRIKALEEYIDSIEERKHAC